MTHSTYSQEEIQNLADTVHQLQAQISSFKVSSAMLEFPQFNHIPQNLSHDASQFTDEPTGNMI